MKVKETIYKSICFRSRLEARWAVFFDELGLKWEYEPEGFKLDNGLSYLPDFYVHNIKGHTGTPSHGDGIFIEVKGEMSDYDKRKIDSFSYPILVVGNIPTCKNPWIDIDSTYNTDTRHLYSEYTIDREEESIWFAKKPDGIYLMRYEETRRDKTLNLCQKECNIARDKKFEFLDHSFSKNEKKSNNNIDNMINDIYNDIEKILGKWSGSF